MISGVGSNLYNLSSYVQSNATLNRTMIDIFGVDIPFIAMANNKDERIERIIRGNLIVVAAFIAPIVSMPFLNKFFLKKEGLLKHPDEKHILQVS